MSDYKPKVDINEEIKLENILFLERMLLVKIIPMDRFKGDLIVPDTSSQNTYTYGEVIKVSPDCMTIRDGHKILFDKALSSVVTIQDQEYQMVHESRDVKAVTNFGEVDTRKMIDMHNARLLAEPALLKAFLGLAPEIVKLLEEAFDKSKINSNDQEGN